MRLLIALLAAASLEAATYYVTVAGMGGEADYETRFSGLAQEAHKLLSAAPDAKSFVLAGPPATRQKLRDTFAQIAAEAKPEDVLVVTLIGHGTFDGTDYKFNLPGPDLSAVELAALLDRVAAKDQLVVNTTSASGGALTVLQKANRVVITATKAGTEKNATVFGRFWVEALRDGAADLDKNEIISALEAYRYADQKTLVYYDQQKWLATEHAMLEDTGKGTAVRSPLPENGQGLLAGRFALLRIGAAQKAAADPAKRALLNRREEIERKIDQLKYNKASLTAGEYRKQLQALLLELARLQAEIDQ
ncbi:MAG: hypothetical protein K2Q23_16055 [Bryobacteraceae bacterium]|nr:hypothetical protein [Bryobacteraceae bacterium]